MIYRFSVISIKIPMMLYAEIENPSEDSYGVSRNSQNNLEKEHKTGTHTFSFQNLLQSYSNQNNVVLT